MKILILALIKAGVIGAGVTLGPAELRPISDFSSLPLLDDSR